LRASPLWPTHPRLVIDPTITHENDGYYCQTISMAEHTGSHVDSPAHIHASMMDRTIDTFAADALVGEAVVYHLEPLGLGPGDQASAGSLERLEAETATKAARGDIVLLDFGWHRYWKAGREGRFYTLNSPGLDESAVRLLAERGIKALGSDTIACDQALRDGVAARSWAHDVHLLPRGVPLMEELANLGRLPSRCFFIALPLRIARGSGSPIRPIALVPRGR
jgi:arylformamidase